VLELYQYASAQSKDRQAIKSPMDEHRIAPRRRMLKAGTIEFGGGGIDCIVRNLSETGAALEVVTPLFIPDRFTLFVPNDQFKRPCHIVWRREKRIGVAFD
jgi:PilZ domain